MFSMNYIFWLPLLELPDKGRSLLADGLALDALTFLDV